MWHIVGKCIGLEMNHIKKNHKICDMLKKEGEDRVCSVWHEKKVVYHARPSRSPRTNYGEGYQGSGA